MRNLRGILAGGALVVLTMVPSIAVAQMSAAEKSRAVQAQLAAIDADRSTFVNNLFASWQPYLDNYVYDPWEELGEIAMKAPAWQLRGASMAGDYLTMMKVLKGAMDATPFNELDAPQQKSALGPQWTAPEPGKFGDSNDQLVYVPISPCRVVDTRQAGARTGIIAAGSTRNFDLELDALTSGQGGSASCTGLPNYSYYGWAVNITVVGYSGTGWLTAWGYTGTEPVASIINYASGASGAAIANGVILTGCVGCGEDITIRASNSATHVIIDVVGYFRDAVVSTSTVTRVAGTTSNLNAGVRAFFDGGDCPAGTRLIGGEMDHSGSDVAIGESRQTTATKWTFWMINNSASAAPVTAYSRCMTSPIYIP